MTQPGGLDDRWLRDDDELLAALRDALATPEGRARTAGPDRSGFDSGATDSGATGSMARTDGGRGAGSAVGTDSRTGGGPESGTDGGTHSRVDSWIDSGVDSGIDSGTTARMLAAARAAFTWRTIDAELELLSASEVSDLALVRGADEPIGRTFEFAGRTVSIELEITPDLIVGQIYPVQATHLTLITPTGPEAEVDSDDVGCFTFRRPGRGPFRLRCAASDAGVITDWICMT